MIGITLKHFAKLSQQGDEVKVNRLTAYLLKKKQVSKFKTRQLEGLSFSDYVDLKRYFDSEDYSNFCRIFVVKKWWQIIYMHHTVAIVEQFGKQKNQLTEKYYYVFDPPIYGDPQKETIGTEVRSEFVQEFGNDVIIMDVLMRWSNCSYKEIEQWKVSEVMFWANYLYGQKIVEGVK